MDRREFLWAALCIPSLQEIPGQVASHPNPCQRHGFIRCSIRVVRGFSMIDADVALPLGIYLTGVPFDLVCMRKLRDRLVYGMGKEPVTAEGAIRDALIDLYMNDPYDRVFLRPYGDYWIRGVGGRWKAELWGSKNFGPAVMIADTLLASIGEVPELEEEGGP